MDRTRWIIFGVLCVGILGLLLVNKQGNSVDVSNIDASKVITKQTIEKNKDIGTISDHVYGTTSEKVTLIEYGDFQCPGCGSLYPSLHPLKEKYKDQLTFVFRNFPLTTIHPNALAAASAAEAAGLQDKFWEYHDKLYENQSEWSSLDTEKRGKAFEGYARSLKLNVETFTKDVGSKDVALKIQRDQALGKKIGASSTPTLVLNGKILSQEQWNTPENLEKTLVNAIKASGQELPKE